MLRLPKSVMPGPLHAALQVLAWLSIPAWPAAVASIWLLDDKGTTVATTGAAVCSMALFIVFLTGRVDQVVIQPREEQATREQAFLIAVDRLSDTTTRPQPLLRVAP